MGNIGNIMGNIVEFILGVGGLILFVVFWILVCLIGAIVTIVVIGLVIAACICAMPILAIVAIFYAITS